MHLLFVTSIVPDGGLGSGYEIANEAIVAGLRRAGVRVTVLGYSWPGRAPSDPASTVVLGEVDVRTDTASPLRKVAWLADAMAQGLTFSSSKMRAASRETVRAAIASVGAIDGYVLNSVQMAGAFEGLFSDRPSLFVAHNVEHRSAAENARTAEGVVARLMFRREARLLETLEARLCSRAAFVWTLADEDRDALGVADDRRSAVLPLVTRTDPPAAPAPREVTWDAALIGTWTWQPNLVGLHWFLDEVVPLLPEGFRIGVAGSAPAGLAAAHPRVTFLGRVPDAHAFVREAAVVPLPCRGGTGVQLKTIETFELGLPSVATSSALRGIGHRPANCVVADGAAAFAQALTRMAAAPPADADGRTFHAAQRAALDRGLARGLERVDARRAEAFA
jgi:hypothetical protein